MSEPTRYTGRARGPIYQPGPGPEPECLARSGAAYNARVSRAMYTIYFVTVNLAMGFLGFVIGANWR